MGTNLQKVDIGRSLEDSVPLSYFFDFSLDKLEVKIKMWNGDVAIFYFHDILTFVHNDGDDIVGLFTNDTNTDLLQKSLKKSFLNIPADHSYKLFQFVDINDNAYLEIVSNNVTYEIINME